MAVIAPSGVSIAPTPAPPKDSGAVTAAENKEMFLKLLVAQLQNQNPASPADPMQFVSQLTQFSTLEQTIAMKQELESIRTVLAASTIAPTIAQTTEG